MSYQIEVEIDGKQFVPLLNATEGAKGKQVFTTVVDNQSRAIITVYLRSEHHRRSLRSIEVSGISPKPAGVPEIVFQCVLTEDYILTFRVLLDGKVRTSGKIPLKKFIPGMKHRKRNISFAVLSVLIAAGVLYFLLRNTGSIIDDAPAVQPAVVESAPVYSEAREAEKPEYERETAAESERYSPESGIESETVQAGEDTAGKDRTVHADEEPSDELFQGTSLPEVEREAVQQGPLLFQETVYFQPDSSVLTSSAKEKLNSLARRLIREPEMEIELTGHCAIEGTEQGRARLSLERALRVQDYLTDLGWEPDLPVSVRGAGAGMTVTLDVEMQHLNRRVEITPVR